MTNLTKVHKYCKVCKNNLPIFQFRTYKKSKGKYHYPYCRECEKVVLREYVKNRKPWIKTWNYIQSRCSRENHSANKCYRNIKNRISREELKYLWFRDKAYSLSRPSIDRINPRGDYTLENCRYIELSENNELVKTSIRKRIGCKKTKKGKIIKIYDSLTSASKDVKRCHSGIIEAMQHNWKSGSYYWVYL